MNFARQPLSIGALLLVGGLTVVGCASGVAQGQPGGTAVDDAPAGQPGSSVWDQFREDSEEQVKNDGSAESSGAASQAVSQQNPEAAPAPKPAPKPKKSRMWFKTAKSGKLPQPAREEDDRFHRQANSKVVSAPLRPQEADQNWVFYRGGLAIADKPFYGPYGLDFQWAYSRIDPLPVNPRIVVSMHGSGAGFGAMKVFGPSSMGDLEVRNQDAEAYGQHLREWWTWGPHFLPNPGRRIAATLHFLEERYQFNSEVQGLILEGPSMGGVGAVAQAMILPDPWRARIAVSIARAGVVLPREVYKKHPGQYRRFPADRGRGKWLWDKIDFEVQGAHDPIVRGIHYRQSFGSNDQFADGPNGSTQLEFVNLVEKYKISGAFSWTAGGHATGEAGLNMPELWRFEAPEQNVTLDRAHPAITNSTGNYPLTAAERVDEARFPRGHYNLGVQWNHGQIVDKKTHLVFPLRYMPWRNFGKGVPDQPQKITISITPRRPKNFKIVDGEVLKWSWNGGELKGAAKVIGDTVTVDNIPLSARQPFKYLRIYR
jgi:hypothetical protein